MFSIPARYARKIVAISIREPFTLAKRLRNALSGRTSPDTTARRNIAFAIIETFAANSLRELAAKSIK